VKNLCDNAGIINLLFFIFISGVFFSHQTIASDRDVEPYLLYVDPVTGKYTTSKPGHESTDNPEPVETNTVTTMVEKPRAEITPVLIISGGILLISQIFALLLTYFKYKTKTDN
jgi:UTP-glucose-1-phosphate uridylyltransferase